MKTINVVNGPQNASEIILGCMRMPALSAEEAALMIRTAVDEGINFFDHATCYEDGEAELRFGGCFIDDPGFPELNDALGRLADKYGVSKSAVAIAWILRHPAGIQAIAGTMNPEHLIDICRASDIRLTHHEWYDLYLASGRFLP